MEKEFEELLTASVIAVPNDGSDFLTSSGTLLRAVREGNTWSVFFVSGENGFALALKE